MVNEALLLLLFFLDGHGCLLCVVDAVLSCQVVSIFAILILLILLLRIAPALGCSRLATPALELIIALRLLLLCRIWVTPADVPAEHLSRHAVVRRRLVHSPALRLLLLLLWLHLGLRLGSWLRRHLRLRWLIFSKSVTKQLTQLTKVTNFAMRL